MAPSSSSATMHSSTWPPIVRASIPRSPLQRLALRPRLPKFGRELTATGASRTGSNCWRRSLRTGRVHARRCGPRRVAVSRSARDRRAGFRRHRAIAVVEHAVGENIDGVHARPWPSGGRPATLLPTARAVGTMKTHRIMQLRANYSP